MSESLLAHHGATSIESFYTLSDWTCLTREDPLELGGEEATELRTIAHRAISCIGEYLRWSDAEHFREDITEEPTTRGMRDSGDDEKCREASDCYTTKKSMTHIWKK